MEAGVGSFISPVFMTCDQVLLMVSGVFPSALFSSSPSYLGALNLPLHLLASEPSALTYLG